jgi:hypothetical protein
MYIPEASNRAGTLSIAESHMPRSWQRVKGLLHGQALRDSVLEKGPPTLTIARNPAN